MSLLHRTSKFSTEDLLKLSTIVQNLTGNQILEKHHAMLESRLSTRFTKLGLNNIKDYWNFYEQNLNSENEALVGLMTTHYTFFFREYIHFENLQIWIDENSAMLIKRFKEHKTPFRLWSAACSKGQEGYSLAMFLEEELVAKYGVDYEIIGSDIDDESVRFAQNGVYPLKETNSIPQHLLNAFWKKGTGSVKDFAAIHPKVKSKVKFRVLNLLDLSTMKTEKPFDVIFARNVFIYFSEENVKKIALGLASHLNPQGVLVSGLSEPLRFEGWTLNSRAPSFYEKSNQMKVISTKTVPKANALEPVAVVPRVENNTYKVLCVDDSKTIQTLMRNIFEGDSRCKGIVSALNGAEAVEKLKTEKFDLITLDIHMPVMGGIEFLESHYDKATHPPVLVISSVNRGDADLAVKALSLGAFDYVEKPAMNKLQQSIDEILTKAHLALKRKHLKLLPSAESISYSESVGQKIVVPDASQSLRWIFCDLHSDYNLEFIFKTLEQEERSPPLLLTVSDDRMAAFEAKVSSLARSIQKLQKDKILLKPNMIYICDETTAKTVAELWKNKNISLQFLTCPSTDLNFLKTLRSPQILVDEAVEADSRGGFSRLGLNISDITPSTSFVSLSLEYFANLRKAQVA